MSERQIIVAPDNLENMIFMLRGQRIMLSIHLAELYGVLPKVLIQSVKRNSEHFPIYFMFQLTEEEFESV